MTDTTTDDVTERDLVWKDAATGHEYRVAFADVPARNLAVLCQKGITHFMGNEQASKYVAYKASDVGKAASKEDQLAWLKTCRDEAFEKVLNGTLGIRSASGAARVTGIDAVMRRIAVEMLTAELAIHNAKLPTGDKTIEVRGKAYTREQLIETMLKRRADLIKQKAQERMTTTGDDLFAEDDAAA
jgi:hypothetical protein